MSADLIVIQCSDGQLLIGTWCLNSWKVQNFFRNEITWINRHTKKEVQDKINKLYEEKE